MIKKYLVSFVLLFGFFASSSAWAGAIFLTGHDPDFHAVDNTGARNINVAAINYILDVGFNDVVAGGTSKFLFVQGDIPVPSGHRDGVTGLINSGYVLGVDFDVVSAAGLDAALNQLGTTYAGLVIASDFGGLLTQAELDILNTRSGDIIDFLNNDNGGLYAMSEGNSGSGLTPGGGWYGFLPFVVSSTAFNSSEAGITVTALGSSLGLTDADVSSNFSHNIFTGTGGLGIVDTFADGKIVSLAGRGRIDPGTGIGSVPEPAALGIFGIGLIGLGLARRRRRRF